MGESNASNGGVPDSLIYLVEMAERAITDANQRRMGEVEEIRGVANDLIATVNLATKDQARLSEAQQVTDAVNKLIAVMNRRIHVANRLDGKLRQLLGEVRAGGVDASGSDRLARTAIFLIRAAYLSMDELMQLERENPELAGRGS